MSGRPLLGLGVGGQRRWRGAVRGGHVCNGGRVFGVPGDWCDDGSAGGDRMAAAGTSGAGSGGSAARDMLLLDVRRCRRFLCWPPCCCRVLPRILILFLSCLVD